MDVKDLAQLVTLIDKEEPTEDTSLSLNISSQSWRLVT